MAKHMLLDILSGECSFPKAEKKGVCQNCGHYTKIDMSPFGTRICAECENVMESKTGDE